MRSEALVVLLSDADSYKKEFQTHFVGKTFSIYGVPVEIVDSDFDHIFYELDSLGTYVFCERRAKRMHFIRCILNDEVAREVTFQPERGTFAIFCTGLECVVYLRIRVGSGKLQLGTFFDFGKEHTKMYEKQRKKCEPISDTQFRQKVLES